MKNCIAKKLNYEFCFSRSRMMKIYFNKKISLYLCDRDLTNSVKIELGTTSVHASIILKHQHKVSEVLSYTVGTFFSSYIFTE